MKILPLRQQQTVILTFSFSIYELKVYKLNIEEMYDKLLEKLTGIVKNTFQSTGNLKESSLRTIFERWSEKNKEKLNGVVIDYSASILFKCVTDNDLNNEEKIISYFIYGLFYFCFCP